jgi:uncharacterized membrane protein YphA (DoxX/SURF4 family)
VPMFTLLRLPSLLARVVLIVVFGFAALAKARDPEGTRTGTHELGISGLPGRVVATVLAPVEVTIAVLLAWKPRLGAIGAIMLLAMFTVALSIAVVQGKSPQCHCFGQRSKKPAGPDTLVRNIVLLVLAIVVATRP